VNVVQGVDYSFDPTAIDGFVAADTSLHSVPGSTLPNLGNADKNSIVIQKNGAATENIETRGWPFGEDAVSAVLMRDNVINEYTVETGLNAGTDWVVTFPNKNLYVFADAAYAPFTARFGDLPAAPWFTKDDSKPTKWKACEPVTMSIYGREEEAKGLVDFSPSTSAPKLCYESNVITFKSSNVLGSLNLKKDIADVFSNGWMNLNLGTGHALISPDTNGTTIINTRNGASVTRVRYTGLPVVGFAVNKLVNGNVGGVLSNYGGSYAHKYTRNVIVTPIVTP
jgi:hypothetical protein